jgi:hypothetical protein
VARSVANNLYANASEKMEDTQHGSALAMRHAVLTAEKFGNDTTDRAAAQDGIGVAAICGNEFVVGFDGGFDADRDGLLHWPHPRVNSALKLTSTCEGEKKNEPGQWQGDRNLG